MPLGDSKIYEQHPDWLHFWGLLLVAGVAFIMALEAGAGIAGFIFLALPAMLASYSRYKRCYTVTNQRVIVRVGLIARNTNEMEIRHIRGINVRQNVFERFLGIGTLEVVSAADGGAGIVFCGIRDPFGVKDRIRSLRPAL